MPFKLKSNFTDSIMLRLPMSRPQSDWVIALEQDITSRRLALSDELKEESWFSVVVIDSFV